ncbi:MAG TPA: methyltransferase domain-containing protein [Haliangium sp.]|nr:methyltransferase domain-containing protein [Haliangium sp.]
MQIPRRFIHVAVLLLAACGGGQKEAAEPIAEEPATPAATEPVSTEPTPEDEQALRAAVESEARPADDRARDEARKPYELLRFFDIRPGMHVADVGAGGGYFSELLARAVGPEGRVYVQNTPFVIERFAGKSLGERLARLDMPHIQRIDAEYDAPGLPAGELDAVVMLLVYHDTPWIQNAAGDKVDRAKMNRAIFDALKPGGVFGVIDHHAQAGSRDRDTQSLHRIDAELVEQDILAAGFELEAESDVLRHPEDDRTKKVFDPALRGKTDQFVYRFRKPR